MTAKPVPSDALVFFGATGDLAHKKIFPAVYNMIKRGDLNIPVIGVGLATALLAVGLWRRSAEVELAAGAAEHAGAGTAGEIAIQL